MLHENQVLRVDQGEVRSTVSTLGHPMGKTVHSDEHWRARLEILFHPIGGISGSELGPESLEDDPRNSGILEAEPGQIL